MHTIGVKSLTEDVCSTYLTAERVRPLTDKQ